MEERATDPLLENCRVQERPFTSNAPLVGNLFAWLRAQWNNVSTRYYVQALLSQQNEFNHMLVEQLYEQDAWLIAQDREQAKLLRETAVITTRAVQLRRRLQSIEQRLTRLEA